VAWGDGTAGPHEAGLLALDASKARAVLGVRGLWSTGEAIDRAVDWYVRQVGGESALALCHADIEAYEARSADGTQL
jgi:CDP-glucose 4,6-dehydratase